jgi:PAS domain S-box-containing protein
MATDVKDGEERSRTARGEERQTELPRLSRRSALEWRLTFDAIASPLLLVEPDGRIIRMNEAARDLAGATYEGAIHRPLAVLGDRHPWKAVEPLLWEVADTGRRANAQVRDREKAWDISVSPVEGPDGGRWAVVVVLDISEVVRLEESLRHSETMSVLGALVAGVAHEVRNPLFGISATLDAFESKFKRRKEYQRYVEVLRDRVGRLNELMHQLLDYGKPQRLNLAEVNPAEVMGAAVEACSPLAAKAGVEVVRELGSDVPWLTVDRNRVVQIFQNLLENAIQHSPKGGQVTFRAEPEGENVRFSIEDSGPGFRPEDLDRMFEPFYSRRRGGTGLGLSIVQRIAEQHGGGSRTARTCGRGPRGGSPARSPRSRNGRSPPPARRGR